MVAVIACVPSGVTVAGLKVQAVAFGSPVQAKVTAELKPFCGVMVIVDVPLAPGATVNVVGFAAIVKFGGGGALTTTVTAEDAEAAKVLLPA